LSFLDGIWHKVQAYKQLPTRNTAVNMKTVTVTKITAYYNGKSLT